MKKFGVIVNPHAKKVRKGKVSIDFFTKKRSDTIDVRVTNTLDEIDNVIKDFKKSGISYIGITGGDGSLHHVITKIIHIYKSDPIPPILILKGGTMDNVAKSISLGGNCYGIMERFTRALEEGKEIKTLRRDTMLINNRYCFLFGNGFTANFLTEVYRYEKGIISNARVIFKAISHAFKEPKTGSLYKAINADVFVDGTKIPFSRITAILAGTVENISRGVTPLKMANQKERAFQALISGFSGLQILRRIYFLLGVKINHKLMVNGLFQEMKIQGKESFDYTMDGDMYQSDGTLTVQLGPPVDLIHV